jgi:SRSO17 transposase
MNNRQPDFSRQSGRLQVYLESLTRAAGHADRVIPIENYTKGLLLPIARKSVEPMAARLAPGNVRQMHQSLHHIVADADAAQRNGEERRMITGEAPNVQCQT